MREKTAVTRSPDGKWLKGASPNPGGRPVGIGSYLRSQTNDLQEMADIALTIARGQVLKSKLLGADGEIDLELLPSVVPVVKERLEAVKWIVDRGAGKVREAQPDEFANLSNEQIIELLQAALAKRSQTAPSTEVSQ